MSELHPVRLGIWAALLVSALLIGIPDRIAATIHRPQAPEISLLAVSSLVTVFLFFLKPGREP